MIQDPIYVGTTGLSVKVELVNVETLNGAVNCKFYVMIPGEEAEATWVATPIVDTNILEYKIPANAPLVEGTYKLHPYFELGDFKGRWSPVNLIVWPHWKRPKPETEE